MIWLDQRSETVEMHTPSKVSMSASSIKKFLLKTEKIVELSLTVGTVKLVLVPESNPNAPYTTQLLDTSSTYRA